MSKIIICSGIPLAGKSTWCSKQKGYNIISRDAIRLMFSKGKHVYNPDWEYSVTKVFNKQLKKSLEQKEDIILDNTFVRQKYINEVLKIVPEDYEAEIKYFPISLWKAYVRNVWRYWRTGKWIPFSVIRAMKRNFDKLEKR